MRVDKLKNLSKLKDERLTNPLQTTREIADKLGIDHGTVAKLDKELPQIATKDLKIIALTDKDFDIMMIIQKEKERRLLEETKQVNNTDIDKWEQTATRRYSLFRGDITDEKGGIKNVENINII